jgi:MarR-like DNA-binding transcriptional regulator SgrR of sgrS sRNA
MKLSGWQWFVVSSLLLVATAPAETRPQYGGVLRIATRLAPSSLDPTDATQSDTIARRNVLRLMFDTLVTLDDRGRLQPALAISWRAEPGNQRWQFWLRPGITFQDGSLVTPEAVAASLRVANPNWTVVAATDSVMIQTGAADADITSELTLPRNAIVKRGPGGAFVGAGAFRVTSWQPGKFIALATREDYWAGRAFVDAIEIELGKSQRDQLIELDLDKIQIAEVAPDQTRRLAEDGRHVMNSAPIELMAVVFAREPQSSDETKLRDVLALSIDRASIRSGVLQDTGEASGSILPDWISGYAFLFPTNREITRAQEERSEIQRAPALTLGYDSDDGLARLVAERLALNARDAGVTVQTAPSNKTEIRIARVTVASVNSSVALTGSAAALGLAAPTFHGGSIDDVYQAEIRLLRIKRVIPLFQLPVAYAVSPAVHNWNIGRDGSWHLADVWVGKTP